MAHSANARAARLMGVQLSTMDPGDTLVLDVRGFSTIRASISSGSSDGTLTISRVNTPGATANPSSGQGGPVALAGADVGSSTTLTIDWPFYRFALSTGSTAAGAYIGVS